MENNLESDGLLQKLITNNEIDELNTDIIDNINEENLSQEKKQENGQINDGNPFIGKINEAPAFLIDNEYILSGYRINFNNVGRILKSLFMFHNETFNVWSHLLGTFAMIFLIFYTAFCIHYIKESTYPSSTEVLNETLSVGVASRESLKVLSHRLNSTLLSLVSFIDINRHLNTFMSNKGVNATTQNFSFENTTNKDKYQAKDYIINIEEESEIEDSINTEGKKIKREVENIWMSICDKIIDIKNEEDEIKKKSCKMNTIRNNNKTEQNSQYLIDFLELKNSFFNYMSKINPEKEMISSTGPEGKLLNEKPKLANKNDSFGIKIEENLKNINRTVSRLLENFESMLNESPNDDTTTFSILKFPVFSQIIGAIICLSFSATFHLFQGMSKFTHDFFSRFDYGGISLLIAGSCWPAYYYYFYCNNFYMILYLTLISVFSVAVFLYSFKEDFPTPAKRKLRGGLYLALGISAGVPIVHLFFFPETIKGLENHVSYFYWGFGGAAYIIGATIYMLRFPEKIFKGIFDNLGNSHQIFHVGVLIGVACHYKASVDAYFYRNTHGC